MDKLNLTLADIEEAISFIDPNLPFYVQGQPCWSRVGRALCVEFGDSAFDIFDSWSQGGNSYNEKEVRNWWRSFRKTRKTNFGSFIHLAMEGGWKPEREDIDEQERQRRLAEFEKRRQELAKKRESDDQKQWAELKKEEKAFLSWPNTFAPTGYMLEKHMSDLSKFVDVRLGKDDKNRPFLAWPIHEELFNKGRFCGYERIIDKRITIGRKKLNKFSSKNTRSDLGFLTLGKEWECDHGREGHKRVFVVGGLADAYACHLVTGEVVVTPIGEGQIPGLISHLRETHPDVEFIAAPDNDKTGRTMAEQSGGMWTVPQTEGRDWSDVWIHEGNQALTEQLLNIRGFEVVESNSRYLQAAIRQGLSLMKSGMGTGKSTTVKKFIQQNPGLKTLIVSHRRALAKSLRSGIKDKHIQIEYYEDLIIKDTGNGIDSNLALRNANILVCSVDSLWRLAGSRWDVVFVDEMEQNLFQYYSSTIAHGEHCLNYLTFALTHSDYQILADAHIGELTLGFCNYIGLQSGTIYDNQYQVGKGKKLFIYESKAHLTEELMQQVMAKGKRYIYANSKAEVKRLATAIEQERERGNYEGKVLVVHADVADHKDVAEALQDINAVVPGLDIIIASPTLGTGFDISSDAHQFDKTIGFLSSRVGTSEEGHQGLNRARDITEFHVYLDPAERTEPTNAEYIHSKLIDEPSAETMKVLAIDPSTGEYATKNPLYEWLFCQVKAKQNISKNRYKARFIELAEQDGYDIVYVDHDEMAAEFGNAIRAEATERTNRELLRDIGNAPIHVGEAFDNMMRNGEDFSSVEITKSKVVHDLNLDSATKEELDALFPMAKELYDFFAIPGSNEAVNDADAAIEFPQSLNEAVASCLTFRQEKEFYVNAIKKLCWVNVTAETAKALDAKDVTHAESRVSWRHLSIRRSHMIKLLQTAGIDEGLNYHGHTWTKECLNQKLGPWLRKKANQDRLYKYSNIKVNAQHLENPCQWLNNHLRSFGVPIVSKKRRVKGKAVNMYSVDAQAWEGVCALVAMRTRGIEASMHDNEDMATAYNVELLQKEVSEFIQAINEGQFENSFEIKFKRLDIACQGSGQAELREALGQAYAQISGRFDDQDSVKNDPPAATVLYKSTGQGGSLPNTQEPSCDKALPGIEGGEERFPAEASRNLSKGQRNVVNEVVRIAVEEHKLSEDEVVQIMLEYGLESFTGNEQAWADTISDILVGEV